MTGQFDEQVELGARERDLAAVTADGPAGEVDVERAEASGASRRPGVAPARRRAARTRATSSGTSNGFLT